VVLVAVKIAKMKGCGGMRFYDGKAEDKYAIFAAKNCNGTGGTGYRVVV
jgi:hypothetical protein